jgi:hypothetical protein
MEEGDSMRLDSRLAGWGVFLILLGAIPLLVRQGVLSAELVSRAWSLWPLLLIAAGLGLLLRRTPLEFVGGLLVAATLGILGGSLLATGFSGFGGCGGDRATTAFPPLQGDLADPATVELTQSCGDLSVGTASGTSWRIEGNSAEPPTVEGQPNSLEVTSGARGFDIVSSQDDWRVTLPTSPRIDLSATVNAGTGMFDLANGNLGQVKLTVNAGGLTLDLSNVAAIAGLNVTLNAVGDPRILLPNRNLSGRIEANAAGNIRLCPPAGAGLRLHANDNITASNNFAARGLSKVGDVWQTPGYETADIRIELETSVNAGSFNLEAEGSCSG